MKRKRLLPVLALAASLFSAGIASAYPFTSDTYAHWPSLRQAAEDSNTIPLFTGAYTGPTYYTFEGYQNITKTPYHATLYIDPSRDLKYYTTPYGIQTGRSYYGEYISGNVFGDITDLVAMRGTGDNFGYHLGGGMSVSDGQRSVRFGSANFHAYETYIFSSLHVGDWIDVEDNWDPSNPDKWIFLRCSDVQTAEAPVPEPATCMLVASGLAGLGLLRKKVKN